MRHYGIRSRGRATLVSQVYWYNSTISLPLDTISILLSEYCNITMTSASTAFRNRNSFSGSVLSTQVSSAQRLMSPPYPDYPEFSTFVLANGTDGAVAGGVTSFAHPTPFIAIAGFWLYTNLRSSGCVLDSNEAQTFMEALEGENHDNDQPSGIGSISVHMKSTFYAPFHVGSSSNVVDLFSNGYTPEFDLDTKAFSEFIVSNTSLLNTFPYLASCNYKSRGVGPPGLQLPVTALIATITAVIKENGPYPTDAPAPGNTVRPHFPAQTTTLPQGFLDQGSPNIAQKPNPQQGAPPAQYSPSRRGSDSNPPEEFSQLGILSFGGTYHKADTSDRFMIAGQTLAPDGPAVTISGTPISLAANATAAVIGASTVPIIHDPAIGMPIVAPVLTFVGSSYTAGASRAFLIAGQTFTPNGIVTISGHAYILRRGR